MGKQLVRFDWAMKKLLRHKANFDILEGFLTELLKFDVFIQDILESESNKEDEYDKFNRVDILIKSHTDELMLVELQNDSEYDYFHRMIYGVSKLITQYIKKGQAYGTIRKVYSINIVYFGLGQGSDYVYEYQAEFVGINKKDVLLPTIIQKRDFDIEKVSDIFPKYYILRVNNFDDVAKNTLDEWLYFLKNSEVKEGSRAKGLEKAKEKLRYEVLSDLDKKIYERFEENLRIQASVELTAKVEGIEKGIQLGEYAKTIEIAKKAILEGFDDNIILKLTDLSLEQIQEIRNNT